jgi:hypothetical protein
MVLIAVEQPGGAPRQVRRVDRPLPYGADDDLVEDRVEQRATATGSAR